MSDDLEPFEPRWEEDSLVLTLTRTSLPAVLSLSGAGIALVCAMILATLAPFAAMVAGGGAGVLTVLGGLAWWLGWGTRVELTLGPDGITRGRRSLARDQVKDVRASQRTLRVDAGDPFRSVLVAMLAHSAPEQARLTQVIRAWAEDPAFGPGRTRGATPTDARLLERLTPLGAEPTEGGVVIPLRSQRPRDLVGFAVAPVIALLAALFLGPVAGIATIVGGMTLAALWAVIGQWSPRERLHVDDRGVTLEGGWFEPWSRIACASVTDQQGVKLHLVDGERVLALVGADVAAPLAALITDLAQPTPASEAPAEARRVQRLRSKE